MSTDRLLIIDGARRRGVENAKAFFIDFKNFMYRGNVVDLAVGIIIGVAFTAVVNSLVSDVITPILSLMGPCALEEVFLVLRHGPGNRTHYHTRQQAKNNGAITLNYGNFFDTVINFFIITFVLFILVKIVAILTHKEDELSTDWPCPKCREMVKLGATRCPHCTSEPISPE